MLSFFIFIASIWTCNAAFDVKVTLSYEQNHSKCVALFNTSSVSCVVFEWFNPHMLAKTMYKNLDASFEATIYNYSMIYNTTLKLNRPNTLVSTLVMNPVCKQSARYTNLTCRVSWKNTETTCTTLPLTNAVSVSTTDKPRTEYYYDGSSDDNEYDEELINNTFVETTTQLPFNGRPTVKNEPRLVTFDSSTVSQYQTASPLKTTSGIYSTSKVADSTTATHPVLKTTLVFDTKKTSTYSVAILKTTPVDDMGKIKHTTTDTRLASVGFSTAVSIIDTASTKQCSNTDWFQLIQGIMIGSGVAVCSVMIILVLIQIMYQCDRMCKSRIYTVNPSQSV